MERVAFILDDDGRRIDCLLNPESLCMRRRAGIAPRTGGTRPVTGAAQGDDPLLYTGGGVTELDLDLLFDTDLAPEPRRARDVRELTRPLWDLAETRPPVTPGARPPLVRFVWGKSWNVPGVVLAVAERLERFTSSGVPGRSWIRLRLRRLAPAVDRHVDVEARDAAQAREAEALVAQASSGEPTTGVFEPRHQALGDAARLDEVAARHYGNPALWRLLALHNGIRDPSAVPPGTVLRVPPLEALQRNP
jgi:hypothetical protein